MLRVFLLFFCASFASSEISFVNNGYREIVVTISPDIDEAFGSLVIQGIQANNLFVMKII